MLTTHRQSTGIFIQKKQSLKKIECRERKKIAKTQKTKTWWATTPHHLHALVEQIRHYDVLVQHADAARSIELAILAAHAANRTFQDTRGSREHQDRVGALRVRKKKKNIKQNKTKQNNTQQDKQNNIIDKNNKKKKKKKKKKTHHTKKNFPENNDKFWNAT